MIRNTKIQKLLANNLKLVNDSEKNFSTIFKISGIIFFRGK